MVDCRTQILNLEVFKLGKPPIENKQKLPFFESPLLYITDYGHPESVFFQKKQTFGHGQTFWAEFF